MRDDLLQSRSYVWDCVRQLRQTDFESLLDSTDEVHGLSFEAAVQPLTQLIALFDDLSPERIERRPAEPIELLAQASSALLKCLEEIRHFSYEEENANEKQLSLIERISGIGLEFTEIFRLIDLDRTPEPEIESRPAGAPLPQTSLFLAEQINLNDMEITRRRELLGISEADIDLLGRVRGIVVEEVDRIVEEFYIKQTSIEEVAVVIGDRDTLERLKNAQR